LFLVQPMIAKMILPQLGGSAAVWTTCMLFFQATLLAGYALAHGITSRLSRRVQILVQSMLLLAPLAVLPIQLDHPVLPPVPHDTNPIPWLIAVLAVAVGLPFLVLSTMGPLLQRWFAGRGHPAATDPYFLYAASNLGSMLALLCYPWLLEPRLSLPLQSSLWAYGYGLLALLGLGCAWHFWSARAESPQSGNEQQLRIEAESLTFRRRVRWVVLALAPSSLTLGVTTYLSTNIAAIPLLWVIPLALYLLSFIIVFGRRDLIPTRISGRVLPLLVLLLSVLILCEDMEPPLWLVLFINLATVFVASLYCHGELAADRPSPTHLTQFYLWLAVGGALGGLFNAVAAPLLFNRVVEYPLAIVVVCLLRRPSRHASVSQSSRFLDLALPAGVGLVTAALILGLQDVKIDPPQLRVGVILGLPLIVCYTFVDRPIRFALGIGAVFLAGALYAGGQGRTIASKRSFFGVHRVTVDSAGRFHQLVHGNTVHGRQSLDPAQRREPLAYFHRSGPIGHIFEKLGPRWDHANIAVIGLGAGSLACYAEPGQNWTLYEIDPVVERIARNPSYFTFLEDCRARSLQVLLGDGRLRLREAPDRFFDLIVLDAFSSDAIPVHLLTREAMQLYFSKLSTGGVLAFHISNRYLDLQPVVERASRDLKVICRFADDFSLTPSEKLEGKAPSQWAVIALTPDDLGPLAQSSRWMPFGGRLRIPVWTDAYSSILAVFKLASEE
jgi:hypothetical protein